MLAPEAPIAPSLPLPDGPVVLFDGLCNFCNGAIQFIVDREREPRLRFAPLQSELARALLERAFGAEQAKLLREGTTGSGDPDTIVLVEGAGGVTRSTAGVRIAAHLRFPWRLLGVAVVIPRPLRDYLYGVIAKNRYRWFGKTETCRIPTPQLRSRFLAQ